MNSCQSFAARVQLRQVHLEPAVPCLATQFKVFQSFLPKAEKCSTIPLLALLTVSEYLNVLLYVCKGTSVTKSCRRLAGLQRLPCRALRPESRNVSPPPGARIGAQKKGQRGNRPKFCSGNSVVVKASSVILFRLTCCQQKSVLLSEAATVSVFGFRSTWKLQ